MQNVTTSHVLNTTGCPLIVLTVEVVKRVETLNQKTVEVK